MQVKGIAECSKGSILQYIWPSLSYHLSLRSLFWVAILHRFYCIFIITISFAILWESIMSHCLSLVEIIWGAQGQSVQLEQSLVGASMELLHCKWCPWRMSLLSILCTGSTQETSWLDWKIVAKDVELHIKQTKLKWFIFQANDRCIKLTNGCCYVPLLQALKVNFVILLVFYKLKTVYAKFLLIGTHRSRQ